ncbi:Taurine catabolism dioxygenase TauD/TfdA [Macrophomina phaseolina MS6]|uniref:Trimethyllysine dioxygenase n=1 Tax=Macrophomina phaseolina (strain MS6) TaxID=1126212 RepID=K2S5L7_MACPH|nr:Taurine catabolism dioxygenase TauD/TfdA [Macrophomina phaseolina MS6]
MSFVGNINNCHVHDSKPPVLAPPTIKNNSIEPNLDTPRRGIATIPAFWLRDHCRCSECVHPETNQRLVDTFQIPEGIKFKEISQQGDQVHVLFSDGHRGQYSMDFLTKQGYHKHRSALYNGHIKRKLWGSSIKDDPPVIDYESVMSSDKGVGEWTALIRKYGFAYVDGCPATPEATQKLLERIAFIRHTHYGGFWDFTSDLASKDTAYTSIALEAHNDNTYFSDPAGLQMFHLLSHTDGEGGASLLVDGFKVAMELKRKAREAYDILSTTRVLSHASGNDGVAIFPPVLQPVFVHIGTQLVQIRWNNSDRAAIHAPPDRTKRWYWAARKWNELLKSAENEYWEQLRPGRPMIFDNWRVLHGRSAFTGKRRLCGGYINYDDFMSRYRTLNLPNRGTPF